MRSSLSKTAILGALAVASLAAIVSAQAPTPPVWPVGVGPGSAAAPTYISIPMEIMVNKPAAEVWKRVGKFCDIAEWLRIPTCTITAGKDGEFGAVRSVANEVLVAKTELSYTYTQTPAQQARGGRGGPVPYNLYHGTLEARPVTATTTKLVYTLLFDNSMLADDAAREADRAAKTRQFMTGLENMKILAEGGTLPPPPARGAPPAATPPPGGAPGR